LRELVKAGKTVDELAGELKKSPGAIKKKLRRLGLEVVVPIEKKNSRDDYYFFSSCYS